MLMNSFKFAGNHVIQLEFLGQHGAIEDVVNLVGLNIWH